MKSSNDEEEKLAAAVSIGMFKHFATSWYIPKSSRQPEGPREAWTIKLDLVPNRRISPTVKLYNDGKAKLGINNAILITAKSGKELFSSIVKEAKESPLPEIRAFAGLSLPEAAMKLEMLGYLDTSQLLGKNDV